LSVVDQTNNIVSSGSKVQDRTKLNYNLALCIMQYSNCIWFKKIKKKVRGKFGYSKTLFK